MNNIHPVCLMPKSPVTGDELAILVTRQGGFRLVSPEEDELGLVIVELGRASDNDFDLLRKLDADPRVTEIFVTARKKDPDLIIEAMRAGATEFMAQPLRPEDMSAALEGYLMRCRTREAHPVATSEEGGRIVHVVSAKGGVGGTTVTASLGVLAAQRGETVLMDMRLPQGDVPLFLDLAYTHTWASAMRDLARLDATFLRSLVERHSSGLHVLPSPDRQDELESLSALGVKAMLGLMRATFPTTIVDGGPFSDELALASMQQAESILLVTELALPSLSGARRILDDIRQHAPQVEDRVRLVVNRLCSRSGVEAEEAEQLLERKVFCAIPDDYSNAVSAINQGVPLVTAHPRSAAARALQQLGERTFPQEGADARPGGLFARLLRRGEAGQASVPQTPLLHGSRG